MVSFRVIITRLREIAVSCNADNDAGKGEESQHVLEKYHELVFKITFYTKYIILS